MAPELDRSQGTSGSMAAAEISGSRPHAPGGVISALADAIDSSDKRQRIASDPEADDVMLLPGPLCEFVRPGHKAFCKQLWMRAVSDGLTSFS